MSYHSNLDLERREDEERAQRGEPPFRPTITRERAVWPLPAGAQPRDVVGAPRDVVGDAPTEPSTIGEPPVEEDPCAV